MKMALATLIKAIFALMGKPDTAFRQCPLAIDKWVDMVAGPIQTMLGLVINTNELTFKITGPYMSELCNLIKNTWHKNHQTFTVSEAQQLTGKLGHLVEGAPGYTIS